MALYFRSSAGSVNLLLKSLGGTCESHQDFKLPPRSTVALQSAAVEEESLGRKQGSPRPIPELYTITAKKAMTAAIAIPARGTRHETGGPAWHRLTTHRAHGSTRIFHGASHRGGCYSLRSFAAAEDVFASANSGSGGGPRPRLSSGQQCGVDDARGAREREPPR
ncbi:hypothetical protein MTO96_027646 [Rhipicephalus appendiculatus]